MPDVRNLLKDLPVDVSAEVSETLAINSHVLIARIVSNGQASPPGFWYDQDEHEFIVLLSGAAKLEIESEGVQDRSSPPAAGTTETLDLVPGSSMLIPIHRRHRVAWTDPTQPTVWLAVSYRE